jgi:Tfp pilus assembly protein PilP
MIKLLILTITINVQAQSSISKMLKDSSIKIKDPLSLRDPFKREKRISNEGNNGRGQILINNKFSNLPVIESIELDQLRVVGVLLGEKRRAITRIISAEERVLGKETYIIKE